MATTSNFIKYQVTPEKTIPFEPSTGREYRGSFSDRHGRGNMTDMLVFPSDVGADPGMGNQGHYIMFFVDYYLIPTHMWDLILGRQSFYCPSNNAKTLHSSSFIGDVHK